MLIPTEVNSMATLAVPDPSYWASTAAQYVSGLKYDILRKLT